MILWPMLMLGCALQQGEGEHVPTWTPSLVLSPTIERMDSNEDGVIDEQEYDSYNYAAPPFSEADLNGDGNFEASELLAYLAKTDPLDFDGDQQRRTPSPRDVIKYFPEPYPVRIVHNLFRFLGSELLTVSPESILPNAEVLLTAARTRSLTSTESRAVLDALVMAYQEAGMEFPEDIVPTRSKGKGSKTKGSKTKGSKTKSSKAADSSRKSTASPKKGKARTQAQRGKAGKAAPR